MDFQKYKWPLMGVVVVSILGFIAYGQLKSTVRAKVSGVWMDTIYECPSDEMNLDQVESALALWRSHGLKIELECSDRSNATMTIDPTVSLHDSAEDIGERHGVTKVTQRDGVIIHAESRFMPNPTLEWVVHEVGHQAGFGPGHPNFCPSGHVMHPHHPGLEDFRGHEF